MSPHHDTVEEAHLDGQCFMWDEPCQLCDEEREWRNYWDELDAYADIRFHEDREEGRA